MSEETCGEVCGDNRFEIIESAKRELLHCTNIESSPDEMSVLDSILFRLWQMNWLPGCKPKRNCDVGKEETVEANNAKLREALEELVANIEMRANTIPLNAMVDTKAFLDAKAALSAPPRNCDLGTVEEQIAGFYAFCCTHKVSATDCGTCPAYKEGDRAACRLIWAQMPCE